MPGRLKWLEELARFSKPAAELRLVLSQLAWDYEGRPFIVTGSHVIKVLERFLRGELSAEDVEAWADLVELREDMAYEEGRHSQLKSVIHALANPLLEGKIDQSSVTAYRDGLIR